MEKQDIGIGLLASVLLLAAYLGLLTLLNGEAHALDSLQRNGFLLLPLVGLFGAQMGLYAFAHRVRKANPAMMAAGGVSAGSMAACCAHHVLDLFPLLGMAGIAAALASYEQIFLGFGLLAGAYGLVHMLTVLETHGLLTDALSFQTQTIIQKQNEEG
ncbi:MAG: hypothetical protein Q8P05_04190 [Candidatus Diapherotrites archaeon]|nr:hypothetical protein [Candidatus Diapherotrites archaeon]